MSADTFEIVQRLNPQALETQILLQCAPVISGLKVANLLIIPRESEEKARTIVKGTHLSAVCLAHMDKKVTMLLYREQWLKDYLQEEEVRNLLSDTGCHEKGLYEILHYVKKKYAGFLEKKGEFPHELGLLLGYPAEDVKGYMDNKGRNALCTGYWQVYADPVSKKNLFRKFEQAKESLIRSVSGGRNICEVIQLAGG
ncbi:MAG: DUF3793 family protein [Eubacteriales bacterium]|nr:DUF3793 family protein [Eubacteriales bacterium]